MTLTLQGDYATGDNGVITTYQSPHPNHSLPAALALLAVLTACNQSAAPENQTGSGPPTETAIQAPVDQAPGTESACERLAGLVLDDTTITLAERVGPGAFPAPPSPPMGPPQSGFDRLPAFCRVAATITPTSDSQIKIEVWMPEENWNGKFVGVGNGVWAGNLSYGFMVEPVARGYASATTDTGHEMSAMDASFAAGHPEKFKDFGDRAIHEMTLKAKALIAAYYGAKPQRSLWTSCSTGGRQGLMEASRHPRDYDAIAAMAPANPMIRLMIGSLWSGDVSMKDAASRLTPVKLKAVHEAVLKSCDASDGVTDRIVSDPRQCSFDPAVLLCTGGDAPDCLTPPQADALRAIYAGPVNPRTGEEIYPGFSPGSEELLVALTSGPEPFAAATTLFRSVVFKDPHWDYRAFDYDKDATRVIAEYGPVIDAGPDISQFVQGGGKLLLSHGWADGLIPARSTISYYEAVKDELSAETIKDSVALFMMPGVSHCGGGSGPFLFDTIGILETWLDDGTPPEMIIAHRPPDAEGKVMSRPLCPYPQRVQYKGESDTDQASSFTCTGRDTP